MRVGLCSSTNRRQGTAGASLVQGGCPEAAHAHQRSPLRSRERIDRCAAVSRGWRARDAPPGWRVAQVRQFEMGAGGGTRGTPEPFPVLGVVLGVLYLHCAISVSFEMFEALSGMGIWTNSAARAEGTRARTKSKQATKEDKKVAATVTRNKVHGPGEGTSRPLRERTNQQSENLQALDPVAAFQKFRGSVEPSANEGKPPERGAARLRPGATREPLGRNADRALAVKNAVHNTRTPQGAHAGIDHSDEQVSEAPDRDGRSDRQAASTRIGADGASAVEPASPFGHQDEEADSPGWLGAAKNLASTKDDQVSPLTRILQSQGASDVPPHVTEEKVRGLLENAPEESDRHQGPLAAPSPLQRRLMRMSPNMHIVSLENIARLYLELQADREYLIRESEKCYRARAATVQDLREVEAALAELLTKKHALEEKLESLGERDELSRLLLGNLDEKVTVIGSESVAFEERIRQLKGSGVAQAVERALKERRGRSSFLPSATSAPPELKTENPPQSSDEAAADMPTGARLGAVANESRHSSSGARGSERDSLTPRLCIRTLYGHTGQVLAADVHEEADIIVSASADRTLRIWDLSVCMSLDESFVDSKDPFGSRKDTLHGHEGWVHALDIHPTGTLLVSGSADRTARLWKLYDAEESASSPLTSLPHTRRHRCLHVFAGGHRGAIMAIQMDDARVITGSTDRTLCCWDLETRARVLRMEGHEAGITALQFWRYGLATASADGTVKMWDMRTGRCHRTLPVTQSGDGEATQASVTCLQFDESRLITGSSDECVRVWDLRTAKCRQVLETGSSINALRFDRDRLYVGCADQVVRAYDMHQLLEPAQGRPSMLRRAFFGHTGAVNCLALSEYGLVSGAADQTLRLWNTRWHEDWHVTPE